MLIEFWNSYLYQPLFNFLIWIYNNWTSMNFGWAVIYMTVMLRVLLLPFTLVNERNRVRNEELAIEVRRLEQAYANDPILKKEEIRRVLKKRRVQPWAKVVVLGVQLLVLILLYQVFLRGVTGEKIWRILYPSITFPGAINTNFYGFELGARHTFFWPVLVGLFLAWEVYVDMHRYKNKLNRSDLMYFVLFPLSVFVVLWYLPLVKSVFILTSMVFSAIIYRLSKMAFRRSGDKKETSTH